MTETAAPPPKPPRRARLRAALARAGLLAGSLAVAFGLGELAARVAYPPARSVSWYHYDPRYGFRHREDADVVTNEWGDAKPWRFRTNARGFRGPAWPDTPAAGTTRVLVMGDSFTFANAVDEDQAYARVAQATIGAGKGWEVLNLGVSAWGPTHALAYLETEGEPIRASCVVYGIFEGNDVVDNIVNHLYEVKEGRLEKVPITAPPPSRLATVRELMRWVPLYDLLLEHSQLFNILRSAGLNTLARHDQTTPKADPYKATSREDFARALELDELALDRFAALARERYGAFALVLIPMRGQIAPDPAAPTPFPEWMAEDTHARVLAWAKRREVPVLDLREALPREPAELAKLYFAKDFHLNAEGNRLLGRLLGERLPAMCAKKSAAPP